MTLKGCLVLIGATLVALGETAWGQKAASNWRVYRSITDGLPESACRSVSIGPGGKVFVQYVREPALSRFDGYTFTTIPSPVGNSGRALEGLNGQIWMVASNSLATWSGERWFFFPVPEIAAELRAGNSDAARSIPLCPVQQGSVAFLTPNRLMLFEAIDPDHARTELLRAADRTRLGRFLGMTAARDGGVWISGAQGLARVQRLKADSEWKEYLPPQSLQIENLHEPLEDEEGSVTVVADSTASRQKVVVSFDGQHWVAKPTGTDKVLRAWRGPGGTYWAATMDSLLEMEEGESEWVENDEISARNYRDTAVARNGTFWLATGDGLFNYLPPAWRSPLPLRSIHSLVHCLAEDQGGGIWFVSGWGLHVLQGDSHREYPFPAAMARGSQTMRSLVSLKNGTLLLDTGEELFQFNPENGAFTPVLAPRAQDRLRILGVLKNGNVCVENSHPADSGTEHRLQIYDGTALQPFPYPLPDLLPGRVLLSLFAAQNGDLWLSGDRDVAWFHDRKWQLFSSRDKPVPESALCFVELGEGRIWCTTADSLWEFDGRNWSVVRQGFDRINDLLRTRDGSVWVASNNGMFRFSQGAWFDNETEEGLAGATIRDIYEDQHGRVWAATTRGLSLNHPEADPDPPQTYVQDLSDEEKNVPEGNTVKLSFSGKDKWKFTQGSRLLFSYRMDQRDWMPFQEATSISFPGLSAGKHYFQVRAMDRNGNIDPTPAVLDFTVTVPWYKESRLLLISFAGLAGALFFAGLAFNRHRRLLRSYADVERKIAERTQELEMANRELLHSQKMNALGTLAAGIAHDFNSILSIVKGSAQIIEDNLDNPEKVRTRVDRIKTVVEQGAGIVKAMLGFSRSSDQQPGWWDVNSVVDDTIKLLGDRFLREADIRFERAPGLPEVRGSRDFLQQIILNFIFNAVESLIGQKQKTVILSARRLEKLPAGVVLLPVAAAGYVAVSVQDFGSGILPENMSRIFEPFFTTKAFSARRGTGLGLSMVYELAKKLAAGLAVESVVGQGSTFTLILPIPEAPAGSGTAIGERGSTSPGT
jgi:signal transduction histidine kinase/ligand-binding sensor domain-containing protein